MLTQNEIVDFADWVSQYYGEDIAEQCRKQLLKNPTAMPFAVLQEIQDGRAPEEKEVALEIIEFRFNS